MPLLDANEIAGEENGPPPSESDKACAVLLLNAIKRTFRLQRGYNLATWAHHFRKLRDVDGVDSSRLEKVLRWYCTSIGSKFLPVVHSAQSFRQKYLAIESAYQRAVPSLSPTEPLPPELERLLTRLKHKHWPLGSGSQLVSVVTASAVSYQAFRRQWRSHQQQLAERDKDFSLSRFITAKLPDAATFLEMWFDRTHQRILEWDGWSGDLSYFTFDIRHPMLAQIGAGWAASYTHNPSRWYVLLERVVSHASQSPG